MTTKKKTFKKRYVLGEGYPWAIGLKEFRHAPLASDPVGTNFELLNFDTALWSADLPKYRLVLERVD